MVRRPISSNRFNSKFTVKTVKHPISVMVWGCFSGSGGHGGLYFLPKNTTMNGEMYETVLMDHLIPFMAFQHSAPFLQGGAVCCASKCIKNFLADRQCDVIYWPGNSPDLNPIKNYMKEKLKSKDTGSLSKLILEIKLLWTLDLSKDSMHRRIQQVLKVKGDATGN